MNVYSLALFRNDASGYESANAGTSRGRFFGNFMKTVVRAHRAVFHPAGWELHIHHDDRLESIPYGSILSRMAKQNLLKLVPMGPSNTLCGSMLWRLTPIFDPSVEYVVCRDVDSLPMERDLDMLKAFQESKLAAHAVLDSESHNGPLMGGMVAFYAPTVRRLLPHIKNLSDLIAAGAGINFNQHGADQLLLNKIVWPAVAKYTMIHQKSLIAAYASNRCLPVHKQTTSLDKVVNHIGAGYDLGKAEAALAEFPQEIFKEIEACEQE